MSNSFNATTDPERPMVYEIRTAGHLKPQWIGWFGEVTITLEENGDTLLTCPVVDQAELYGLLRKVRDLGVSLLSVRRIEPAWENLGRNEGGQMKLTSPLQAELFVTDLDVTIDFYTGILGFTVGERQADGFTPLSNGPVMFSLNAHANLPEDHPVYIAPGESPGRGVEFVLWVEDLRASCAHVKEQGWSISGELQRQPWGLDDFRLHDPNGYYLRFTSRV